MTLELDWCDLADWAREALIKMVSRLGWKFKICEGEDEFKMETIMVVTLSEEDYRIFQLLESFIHDY